MNFVQLWSDKYVTQPAKIEKARMVVECCKDSIRNNDAAASAAKDKKSLEKATKADESPPKRIRK